MGYTWTGCIAFTPDHLMRLFEPAPGLVAVTGYNGRGVTTGSVVGKAFADYLCHQNPQALPIPFAPMQPLAGWACVAVCMRLDFRCITRANA